MVCATSKGSDHPAHTRRLIRVLCQSLIYSKSVKVMTEHRLEFPSITGDCTDSSKSIHVKMLHCWKSHVTAQLCARSSLNVHTHVSSGALEVHLIVWVYQSKHTSSMRAGNSLCVFAGSGLVHRARPSPSPPPLLVDARSKPKRALLKQASMGIQPIANFGVFVFMWAKLMRQYINACAMQFRLPQKSIPYSLSHLTLMLINLVPFRSKTGL